MKFVFCEGKDDVSVIQGVAGSMGLTDLRIEQTEGRNNLGRVLKTFRALPEFTRNEISAVGIIRDADDNGKAALQSVRDALVSNGFNAPDQNGGFAAGGIKTGVLIIGPNNGTGMIEDLCLNSVRHHPEFPCVDDYFRCIAQKSSRQTFSSKARVRVWMASHADHEYYVGKAAEAGYWPWDSPAFDSMKEFLQKL